MMMMAVVMAMVIVVMTMMMVVMTTMEVMTTTMVSFLGLSFGDAVPSHVGNSRRYLDTCGVPCSVYSYSFSGDGDSGDDHDDGGNDDDGGDDDDDGKFPRTIFWGCSSFARRQQP
mmetsp:Transcript_34469/g.68462  ORF Transcript_34469/g.68462 Transcript_34469/m.68462 type:complete len:115 (+) Transcript_34469:59-403(+)